jgi:hypothetical protein
MVNALLDLSVGTTGKCCEEQQQERDFSVHVVIKA